MDRLWLAAVAVSAMAAGTRGGDVDWRPAAPTPPASASAPPVPLPIIAPVAAPPEATVWQSAVPLAPPPAPPRAPAPPPARTVVETPEFRAVSPPGQPLSPLPVPPLPAPPVLVPIASPPPTPPEPPSNELLPALAIPEIGAADDKPEPKPEPKPAKKSELLPAPRVVGPDPAKTKPDGLPKPVPPPPAKPDAPPPTSASLQWTVSPAAGMCPPDTRPVLEPAPNLPGTLGGVPVRGRTFGSPPIRLSRDFAVRDLFGYDLAQPKAGVDRAAPVLPGDGSPTPDDFFVETEYLLWWANRPRIPLLATTSNGTGSGIVGQPGTIPLLGPGTFGPSFRDGFRVRAGAWLDDGGGHGLDASFFFLGRRTQSEQFNGLTTLARPFFSPNSNAEAVEIVALPGLSTGTLNVTADSFLWGADINYRCAVCRTCDRTTAWFAGYRHLNLTETLTITENITASGSLAPDPVGTTVVVQDRFRTSNRFHGGQLGWLTSRKYGRWEVDVRASIALGVNVQTLEIDGFQNRTRPGQATDTFRGGLLATGPNLGQFHANRFSVVPEATVTLGYAVTPRFRLTAGYNFLYWSNVIRPGDQIDRTVDVTLVPNPPTGVAPSGQNRPQPLFRQSDFWTQGITLGAQLRW